MSTKLGALGFFKRKVFWGTGHDAIISVCDVTKKFYHATQIILSMMSYDQSLVTPTFLWEKLS